MLISLGTGAHVNLAKAQAPKTIIVPDDYPTITAAVANASDGDTILVRAGIYNEQVINITKTLSIIGQGAEVTKVNFEPPTIYYPPPPNSPMEGGGWGPDHPIKISANNVVLSGFTFATTLGEIYVTGSYTMLSDNVFGEGFDTLIITGNYETIAHNSFAYGNTTIGTISPTAIMMESGQDASICENTINGSIWATDGNRIIDNNITGYILGGGANFIYGNNVRGGDSFGRGIETGVSSIVAYNTVTGCSLQALGNNNSSNIDTGAISIKTNSVYDGNCIVYGNTITNNQAAAIWYQLGSNNLFYANYIADNKVAIKSTTYVGNSTWYCNDFVNNSLPLQVNGYPQYGYVDNWDYNGQGNYWSDYNGTDTNHDGIGDTPYVVAPSQVDNYPLFVPFNLSTANVQTPSWANPSIPDSVPCPTFPMLSTTILALTDIGVTVQLNMNGNITSAQMSNFTINTNQSTNSTTISFNLTGQSGTTGFSNITIPITAVPCGTTPTIYIDGQPASNQGYTQDSSNYYVWYTTQFSIHQVNIVFANAPLSTPSPSIPEFPWWITLSVLLIVATLVAVAVKRKSIH
jgi:hypothetical protein